MSFFKIDKNKEELLRFQISELSKENTELTVKILDLKVDNDLLTKDIARLEIENRAIKDYNVEVFKNIESLINEIQGEK